jgi:hypothetical protein
VPTEVAFVDLDLSPERALISDLLGDELPELVVVEHGGVLVEPDEVGSSSGRSSGGEVLHEAELGLLGESATSSSGHGGG